MRVLMISDIHANLAALESVLADAEGRYDLIWCLGDLVGYGPRPNECIQIVRERAGICVIGNHDWAALARPGVNVDDFNPHARQAILWTQEELTEESRNFLEGLADEPQHPIATEGIILTHASPREPVWEYILTPTIALQNFAAFDEPLCFVGHTHKPAIYQWKLQPIPQLQPHGTDTNINADIDAEADTDAAEPQRIASVAYLQPLPGVTVNLALSPRQRLIINPGSVGQPRDNDARAAYGIFDLDNHTWRAERVSYPIELTQNQMRAANLPRRLIDRLSFGW